MPKITMGRVGDRTPPSGFLSDLKAFDPDLRIRWDVRDQCWIVFQQVKRSVYCGEYQGARLYDVKLVDEPVLWVSDFTGEPDRRILEQLYKKRARDRTERLARAKMRAQAQARAKKEETAKKIDSVAPKLEEGYHNIRKAISPTVYTS
jgi:hypothetical protein|tara:strand:- start:201 stop:644 length:444 start_codon:yes stop_codon:yes gene_type:complete